MTDSDLEVDVGPSATQVRRAADTIATALADAARSRGRATLALSGGSTVGPLLDALAVRAVPWPQVELVQVDERVAPDGHPDRNLGTIEAHLLERRPGLAPRLHAMPVTAADLPAAAAAYARELEEVAGTPPVLDVVHLGLGPDGHTASLLPGDDTGRTATSPSVVLTGPYQGRRRMTLSLPVLSAARRVVWLVLGDEKADAVRRLVDGDATIPAAAVARRHAVLYVDSTAWHRGLDEPRSQMMGVEVTLLYFDGCPSWRTTDQRLRVLAEELGFELTHRRVDTPEDAQALSFRGSPTVLVDGRDPFARGDEPVGLSCRIYQTPDGPAGSPTLAQLRDALGGKDVHRTT